MTDKNNNIQLYVFDLDGTLMDSGETIYRAMHATFSALGYNYLIPRDWFDKKIGAHFQDIFDEFGIVIPDIEEYLSIYKPLYFNFIDDTKVYTGAEETLRGLQQQGKKIAMLTTKAQDQAEKISEYFGLKDYFQIISGRTPDSPVKPAPEPLMAIYNALAIPAEDTLMIGDTEFDIHCGKNAGARTCAVTYGYRTSEFLAAEQPDFIIDQLPDVLAIHY